MTKNRRMGLSLIVLGLILFIMRAAGFTFASLLWPMWVIVPGALMLYGAFNGKKANVGLAVPGAVAAGTGMILFFANMTGRWEAWAYLWTLYPVFTGGALYYAGKQNDDEKLMQGGEKTATSGLYMLVGFGLFFELLIFGGLNFLDSALLPMFVIAAGLYLMYTKDGMCFNMGAFRGKRKRKNDERIDPETGINPDLRRRMDKALADEEADGMTV
jgi:hypothetical protein